MDGATPDALPKALRQLLEAVLREVGDRVGCDLTRSHAEISFRLEDGRVRWIDPGRVRVPVSELERGFDETASD